MTELECTTYSLYGAVSLQAYTFYNRDKKDSWILRYFVSFATLSLLYATNASLCGQVALLWYVPARSAFLVDMA